jgi:hypothetical protein
MTPYMDIQAEIRRFLLGTLSEDARQGLEERLMTEETFLEELALAESGLIDDYVGERLTADERAEFERHFLSTEERRRQLRFTRGLARYAAAHPPPAERAEEPGAPREPEAPRELLSRPAPTFGERLRAFWGGLTPVSRAGLALACAAVIAGALWLARPFAPTAPTSFPALTLSPTSGDRAAGPETPKARLPLGADALRLVLTLPEGYGTAAAYRAEMLTSAGRTEKVEVVGHEGRTVSVVVPEARLARGQYAIRLYAVATGQPERPLGSYLFNVE